MSGKRAEAVVRRRCSSKKKINAHRMLSMHGTGSTETGSEPGAGCCCCSLLFSVVGRQERGRRRAGAGMMTMDASCVCETRAGAPKK